MSPRTARSKPQGNVSTRRPRGFLSHEEIVNGAFELAAEESVDALSMPRLGKHLAVGVTSIYWYFRSKEELMDALTDEAARRFGELLPEFGEYGWDEHLRQYFRAFRRVFQENPVLCDLIVMRAPMQTRSPDAMRRYFTRLDREIGILVDAGFPIDEATRAYMTLSVYTRGCILNERLFIAAGRWQGANESLAVSRDIVSSLPVMSRAMTYWSPSNATDGDFEAGLSTIIEGLRAQLAHTMKQAMVRPVSRRRVARG